MAERHPGLLAGAAAAVAVAAAVLAWLVLRAPNDGQTPAPVPVILYVVDTLRADRLGAYGSTRKLTPRFDALAAESVLFESAYAAGPWTLPSVASLMTSTWPCEHGVLRYGKKLSEQVPTLAGQLRSLGYRTGAFYNNYWVGGVAGVDRGFEVSTQKTDEENDRTADTAAFLDGIAGGEDTGTGATPPFLLYLHTIEPHHPFNTPYDFIRQVRHVSPDAKETIRALFYRFREIRTLDFAEGRPRGTTDTSGEQTAIMAELTTLKPDVVTLYDAGVAHADANLGAVIDLLKARGLWDRALFIVLSDHGEEFGEHGGWFHDQSVYEELMHVPLLVHFPAGAHAGRRVQSRVSLVDVMPAVLDYLGQAPLCANCRGRSFLPLLKNDSTAAGAGSTVVNGLRLNDDVWYAPLKAARGDVNVTIRRDRLKGIWNPEPGTLELYDLAADPGERVDRSASDPGTARELRDEAVSWLEQCQAGTRGATELDAPDERTRQQLRSLGYFN